MSENTIFSSPPAPVAPAQAAPGPAAGIAAPQPKSPVPPVTLSIPPPSYDEEGPSFVSKLLKVTLAIVILGVVALVVLTVVLPMLQGKKNETVTITYWGLWEGENVMRPIIADFERQHPTIKVQYIKQDAKQYRERLFTRINNNDGPDIFRFHNTWLIMLSSVLTPLPNDTINAKEFSDQYFSVVQKDLTKNGAIYGIPLGIDTLSLFVNTELFEAAGLNPPKTWEEFITVSRALTVKNENGTIKTSGAALGTFDNITHASDVVSLLLIQNGTSLYDMQSTAQNASDALSFYTSFAAGDSNIWDETQDSSIAMFAKGNLAMYFGYSWDVFTIKAMNPNLPFEIHPVPHLPGRDNTIASYWAEGISLKSKHQREALQFMSYLSKKETQQGIFQETSKTRLFGIPYARKDLSETVKDNPYVWVFVNQANTAVSSFFASDTYDNGLNTQMNNYLGNAVRSILNNTSAQSAVETLSLGVAQILSQYERQ